MISSSAPSAFAPSSSDDGKETWQYRGLYNCTGAYMIEVAGLYRIYFILEATNYEDIYLPKVTSPLFLSAVHICGGEKEPSFDSPLTRLGSARKSLKIRNKRALTNPFTSYLCPLSLCVWCWCLDCHQSKGREASDRSGSSSAAVDGLEEQSQDDPVDSLMQNLLRLVTTHCRCRCNRRHHHRRCCRCHCHCHRHQSSSSYAAAAAAIDFLWQ